MAGYNQDIIMEVEGLQLSVYATRSSKAAKRIDSRTFALEARPHEDTYFYLNVKALYDDLDIGIGVNGDFAHPDENFIIPAGRSGRISFQSEHRTNQFFLNWEGDAQDLIDAYHQIGVEGEYSKMQIRWQRALPNTQSGYTQQDYALRSQSQGDTRSGSGGVIGVGVPGAEMLHTDQEVDPNAIIFETEIIIKPVLPIVHRAIPGQVPMNTLQRASIFNC